MKKIRLSFCEIFFLEENIVEVVMDKGVEMNKDRVEEYHGFYKNTFDSGFGVLVNKRHEYSYDFSAMLKIGDLANLRVVAILHFSQASKAAHILDKMPRKQKLNMQHFFERADAIRWLKENLR